MVALTATERALLTSIQRLKARAGTYEIYDDVTHGGTKISRSVLFWMLDDLTARQLVSARDVYPEPGSGQHRERYYQLLGAGEQALAESNSPLQVPLREGILGV
jgi:hypothetical protein